jgi:hypothetical protein
MDRPVLPLNSRLHRGAHPGCSPRRSRWHAFGQSSRVSHRLGCPPLARIKNLFIFCPGYPLLHLGRGGGARTPTLGPAVKAHGFYFPVKAVSIRAKPTPEVLTSQNLSWRKIHCGSVSQERRSCGGTSAQIASSPAPPPKLAYLKTRLEQQTTKPPWLEAQIVLRSSSTSKSGSFNFNITRGYNF